MSLGMSTEQLALLVAIVAVLVGPAVSWRIAKRQILAQVVSANRQNWIIDVRDTLAEFLRDSHSMVNAYKAKTYTVNEVFERFEKVTLATQRMELLLNPKEQDHSEIVDLMKSICENLRTALSDIHGGKEVTNDAERETAIDAITPIAQRILKSEWGRIKKGE